MSYLQPPVSTSNSYSTQNGRKSSYFFVQSTILCSYGDMLCVLIWYQWQWHESNNVQNREQRRKTKYKQNVTFWNFSVKFVFHKLSPFIFHSRFTNWTLFLLSEMIFIFFAFDIFVQFWDLLQRVISCHFKKCLKIVCVFPGSWWWAEWERTKYAKKKGKRILLHHR